ncbi:high-potential iron-sulfur protein [Roseicella aquatilis]|nr:high-potential iron-sulfur protein [Roseicella aquatilis]
MDETKTPKRRRSVLRAAGLAALAPIAVPRARAQDKLQGSMVLYQDKPKDGQKCSNCLHFQPPNACAIVAGEISPEGWCAVWAKKEG